MNVPLVHEQSVDDHEDDFEPSFPDNRRDRFDPGFLECRDNMTAFGAH